MPAMEGAATMETNLIPILLAPLKPPFAILLILVGLYSLTFNLADARRKNHRRSEKLALIGGWLYIIGGAALMLRSLF